MEIFFSPLEFGTNREFLAQSVQKWWLKEGNARNGCCVIFLPFRPSLLMCNRSRLLIGQCLKNRLGMEIFVSPLEFGTNSEFLAQNVQKWCLKEGNARNGCCDIFAFWTLFAHVEQISTSNKSIFKKYIRSGKIFFSS